MQIVANQQRKKFSEFERRWKRKIKEVSLFGFYRLAKAQSKFWELWIPNRCLIRTRLLIFEIVSLSLCSLFFSRISDSIGFTLRLILKCWWFGCKSIESIETWVNFRRELRRSCHKLCAFKSLRWFFEMEDDVERFFIFHFINFESKSSPSSSSIAFPRPTSTCRLNLEPKREHNLHLLFGQMSIQKERVYSKWRKSIRPFETKPKKVWNHFGISLRPKFDEQIELELIEIKLCNVCNRLMLFLVQHQHVTV